MRKIALVAMLAIVGAMVPLTATVSTAAAGAGELRIINGGTDDLDFWFHVQDNDWKKFEIDDGNAVDYKFPNQNMQYVVCGDNGTINQNCDLQGGGSTNVRASGTFALNNGDHLTFVINDTDQVHVGENDTSATKPDNARIILHNDNSYGIPVTVCVNGDVVLPNVGAQQTADAEAKAGEPNATVALAIGGGGANECAGSPLQLPLPFPEGTAVAITTTVNPNNSSALADCLGNQSCIQIFVTGTKAESSDQLVPEFCAALPGLQQVGPLLDELFKDVKVGNPDTYPSPDHVEDIWNQIDKLLDAGDETVPADIKEAWQQATDELRQLLTGLELVNFDVNSLPQDDLQRIVDGVQEPSGPTPEDQATQAELGTWFTTNCAGAIEAQPSFTG